MIYLILQRYSSTLIQIIFRPSGLNLKILHLYRRIRLRNILFWSLHQNPDSANIPNVQLSLLHLEMRIHFSPKMLNEFCFIKLPSGQQSLLRRFFWKKLICHSLQHNLVSRKLHWKKLKLIYHEVQIYQSPRLQAPLPQSSLHIKIWNILLIFRVEMLLLWFLALSSDSPMITKNSERIGSTPFSISRIIVKTGLKAPFNSSIENFTFSGNGLAKNSFWLLLESKFWYWEFSKKFIHWYPWCFKVTFPRNHRLYFVNEGLNWSLYSCVGEFERENFSFDLRIKLRMF